MIDLVNEAINQAASAWWILPLLFAFCAIDAFFPVVPSETFLVSLAAVGVAQGAPNLWWLVVLGVTGAILGDQFTYWLGTRLGHGQLAWMRSARAQKVLSFAARRLESSGALLIFTARYIPIGRVAVNLSAGASGFSYRRFLFFDTLGCLTWGLYSVGIGALAGNWLAHNKLLGIVLSVAIALGLGLILDKIVNRALGWFHRREAERKRARGTSGGARPATSLGDED
ncbi:DedA family protein [Glutamicibacter endophyticus]|uniref:DedA family protein n=1 Tax=Glutamicibacter endophyticus TaxID=1522174 RepID=UPI003AF15CED